MESKLLPIVGYIFWHLVNGYSISDTLERLSQDSRYGWLTPSQTDRTQAQAEQDLADFGRVALRQTDESLIEILDRPIPLDRPLGVRVYTILHCANGMDIDTSVTVNTDPNNSPEAIIAAVEEMINSGAIPWKNKYCTEVIGMDSEISQIFGQGFERPTIVLLEL